MLTGEITLLGSCGAGARGEAPGNAVADGGRAACPIDDGGRPTDATELVETLRDDSFDGEDALDANAGRGGVEGPACAFAGR